MNFSKLVEDGTYKKSDLSEKAQEYISGMEYALEYVDIFVANVINGVLDEDSETLDKIKVEFGNTVMNNFKEWLQSEIDTKIVTIADTEASLKNE